MRRSASPRLRLPPALLPALQEVQNELFVIGSHLATPDGSARPVSLPALDDAMVTRLEAQIDGAEAQLVPLRNFILPGGGEAGARLHLARTVCRRAERLLEGVARSRPVPAVILKYLNRLSDCCSYRHGGRIKRWELRISPGLQRASGRDDRADERRCPLLEVSRLGAGIGCRSPLIPLRPAISLIAWMGRISMMMLSVRLSRMA